MMFEVVMLPAKEGDCLLVRYGDLQSPHQILIDCGRKATYRELLKLMPEGKRHLELFVVSHIDRDHVEGALDLLEDEDAGFSFDDIWFNAYRHLDWEEENEEFGAVQGEKLTTLITSQKLPWNKAFGGGPVRLDSEEPVVRTLSGGMKLTLLSPDTAKLLALKPQWEKECERAGLNPILAPPEEDAPTEDPSWEPANETFGDETLEELAGRVTKEDSAPPNGSSIAFLAEYDGRSVLFAADAHPSILVGSLDLLGRPLPIACDLVKVAHHGSQANTTRALLDRISSNQFLISTNGNYFDHPDEVAIARILTQPGKDRVLHFNYRSDRTLPWDDSDGQKSDYSFKCRFPDNEDEPVTVSL